MVLAQVKEDRDELRQGGRTGAGSGEAIAAKLREADEGPFAPPNTAHGGVVSREARSL
jgi:hypothetical protein